MIWSETMSPVNYINNGFLSDSALVTRPQTKQTTQNSLIHLLFIDWQVA